MLPPSFRNAHLTDMGIVDLPDEIVCHIGRYLSLEDLLSVAETCVRLQTLVTHNLSFLGYAPHRAREVAAALSRCSSASQSLTSVTLGPSDLRSFPSSTLYKMEDPTALISPCALPIDIACRLQYWRTVRALLALSHGWTGAAITSLCAHGAENLLRELLVANLVPVPRSAAISACQKGQVGILQALHRSGRAPFSSIHMEAAVCAGRREAVEALASFGVPITRDCIMSSAFYGHEDILSFFMQVAEENIDSGAIEVAASSGHVPIILKLLALRSRCAPTYVAIEQAAMHGHLSVVKILFESFRKTGTPPSTVLPSTFALDEASSNGHFAVVQYLLSCKAKASSRALDEAAENGHHDIVQLLHKHDVRGTANAVDYAARNGRLAVVRFLLEVGYRCTSLALDLAACYGHTEILQLLHECGYRCSHVALIYALNARHMPTVKYLHRTAQYPFIARHLFHSVHIGFLEGVEFLLSIGVRPGEGTVEHACTMGFLEIVQLLMVRYGQPCSPDGLDYACARGHANVARFLASKGVVPTRQAMRGACRNGHLGILQLLCDRFALHPSEADYQAALTAGHVHILGYLDARAGLGLARDSF